MKSREGVSPKPFGPISCMYPVSGTSESTMLYNCVWRNRKTPTRRSAHSSHHRTPFHIFPSSLTSQGSSHSGTHRQPVAPTPLQGASASGMWSGRSGRSRRRNLPARGRPEGLGVASAGGRPALIILYDPVWLSESFALRIMASLPDLAPCRVVAVVL